MDKSSKNVFHVSGENFKKIPGSPIAYWVGEKIVNLLEGKTLDGIIEGRIGLATGNNAAHLRLWFELSYSGIGFGYDRSSAKT